MDVPQIVVDREQAAKEYDLYRAALKTKKDAFLHDLKVAYGHMRHGKAVLDIWQAFAEQGINEKGNPRIAVARADWTDVRRICNRYFKIARLKSQAQREVKRLEREIARLRRVA